MSGRSHARLTVKLLGVAVAMFLFGVFAMPPLYDTFCEITGIGQAGIRVAAAAPTAAASVRTVRVRFDANTQSTLNWRFEPEVKQMDVALGEATSARYQATNLGDEAVTGRAVFNVSPPLAARYFVKTECFCFSAQQLDAGEARPMPVYFYISQDLPDDVTELTLSYTFFEFRDDEA